jgi:hypothetical protein
MARLEITFLLLLFGCSGGVSSDGGVTAGSLTGTGAFAVNYAGEEFAPQSDLATPDLSRVAIHLSSLQWPCDGGTPGGTHLRFEAATSDGGAMANGTYPVSFFQMRGIDPTSGQDAIFNGASGAVTFSAIDVNAAAGSFSVDIPGLGALRGNFQAPFCTLRNPLHDP